MYWDQLSYVTCLDTFFFIKNLKYLKCGTQSKLLKLALKCNIFISRNHCLLYIDNNLENIIIYLEYLKKKVLVFFLSFLAYYTKCDNRNTK